MRDWPQAFQLFYKENFATEAYNTSLALTKEEKSCQLVLSSSSLGTGQQREVPELPVALCQWLIGVQFSEAQCHAGK